MTEKLKTPPLVKRYPVPLTEKQWASSIGQIVMGIDPGFASGGVAILKRSSPSPQSPVRALAVKFLGTEKATKKARNSLRVSADDFRRYKELWLMLEDLRIVYCPYAVGVEAYMPQGPRGGGQATKTLAVYGGVLWWALSRGLFVAPFVPSDLKIRFGGSKSASKEDVEAGLCREVEGLKELIAKIPKTHREHVADAAGHAFLVLEEIQRTKHMLGLV